MKYTELVDGYIKNNLFQDKWTFGVSSRELYYFKTHGEICLTISGVANPPIMLGDIIKLSSMPNPSPSHKSRGIVFKIHGNSIYISLLKANNEIH